MGEPRAVGDLVHVEKFFARNLGGLTRARTRAGPAREDRSRTPSIGARFRELHRRLTWNFRSPLRAPEANASAPRPTAQAGPHLLILDPIGCIVIVRCRRCGVSSAKEYPVPRRRAGGC